MEKGDYVIIQSMLSGKQTAMFIKSEFIVVNMIWKVRRLMAVVETINETITIPFEKIKRKADDIEISEFIKERYEFLKDEALKRGYKKDTCVINEKPYNKTATTIYEKRIREPELVYNNGVLTMGGVVIFDGEWKKIAGLFIGDHKIQRDGDKVIFDHREIDKKTFKDGTVRILIALNHGPIDENILYYGIDWNVRYALNSIYKTAKSSKHSPSFNKLHIIETYKFLFPEEKFFI